MTKNACNNENDKSGETSSKIWRKFKDVRRCPLKSDEWRKRQIGKKDKFGENWKVMSKGVSWKVVILTKNGKFGENDEFAILVTSYVVGT